MNYSSQKPPNVHILRFVAASSLFHAMVLLLLLHRHGWVAPMKLPGEAHGTRVSLTYTPGRATLHASIPVTKPLVSTPVRPANPLLLLPRTAATQVAASSAPAPNQISAPQGTDARGTGNVTLALATFFPRPRPDLSQLPSGSRGDVVVDVVIDETGKITSSTIAQSLGPGVDETVLATIQTWTFKPATRDGVPVASEQELLFHYEHG